MKSVNISELRSNLLKYLKSAQHGEQINITSKGVLLATLTPPINKNNLVKAKLEKIAKTAVIHDVVTPTEEDWDVMQ